MNQKNTEIPKHPGIYIREEVLPKNMTVTKAAKLLGIGRPALSNLLNGKSSLSAKMAMRLQNAFGISSSDLLEIQKKFTESIAEIHKNNLTVGRYVHPYFSITANEISNWAERIVAREQFPALLRTLIHSSGNDLTLVDFPAFDNSQRRGWDGRVASLSTTPWIPKGKSCWEFGCGKDYKNKANKDFGKRTYEVSTNEQESLSFVFVTPRNWPKKDTWIEKKKQSSSWKDIKVYDASDLEQWIEQSTQAQVKILEFMGRDESKVKTLDQIWKDWSDVTKTGLPKDLFNSAVELHRKKLEDWLSDIPEKPFVIIADSNIEALAFLNCALDKIGDKIPGSFERSLVVNDYQEIGKIAWNTNDTILIVASPKVEKELAGSFKKAHTIIVRGRNMVTNTVDVKLDLLDHEAFNKALKAFEPDEAKIRRLERESARSPTILRRRLAAIPEIMTPSWVDDPNVIQSLIPLILIGAWDSSVKEDREILKYLTQTDKYDDIESTLAKLQKIDESPVWSIGHLRGIFSKIDSLFAVQKDITKKHLEDFLELAKYVLEEQDPALELPEEKRWAASLYGKYRDFSDELRKGMCDTLILLAVHGDELVSSRLQINLKEEVSNIVQYLVDPLKKESVWLSHRKELPFYAEAAPEMFLKILEADLDQDNPQVADLFVLTKSEITSECLRSHILWALEILAWNPDYLPQVVRSLARMCKWEIQDNWTNKPISTLGAIFQIWKPQTSLKLNDRIMILEDFSKEFPKVGWQICIAQFDPNVLIDRYNIKPRWRTDGLNAGEVTSKDEIEKGLSEVIEITLSWPNHDEYTLGDLITRIPVLDLDTQNRIWNLVNSWNETLPPERKKAYLSDQIHELLSSQKYATDENIDKTILAKARQTYDMLKPTDPVLRHKWLFQHWVPETADEIEEDQFDYKKKEQRIKIKRLEALKDIMQSSGVEGIKELCGTSGSTFTIGELITEILHKVQQVADFVQNLMEENSNLFKENYNYCIAGCLSNLELNKSNTFNAVLTELLRRFDSNDDKVIHLLTYSPFSKSTWAYVNRLPKQLKTKYWEKVKPDRLHSSNVSSYPIVVDELLKVNRPCAAFISTQYIIDQLDTKRLKDLLYKIATNNGEESTYFLRVDCYYISQALDILEERNDTSSDDLAKLEFLFISILDRTDHGIRNLEIKLSNDPNLFMEALIFAYKRSENGEDPPEWTLPSKDIVYQYIQLLRKAKRIPGTEKNSKIDVDKLREWLRQVRMLSRKYGRINVGDRRIGELLSHSPIGDDGVWPCEEVREVLEEIRSPQISTGIGFGIRNSEGPVWRIKNDNHYYKLAKMYQGWSKKIHIQYPFTAKILKDIASSYFNIAKAEEQRDKIFDMVNL